MKTNTVKAIRRRVLSGLLSITMLASMIPAALATGAPTLPTPDSWLKVTEFDVQGGEVTALKVNSGDVADDKNIFVTLLGLSAAELPTDQNPDPDVLVETLPQGELNTINPESYDHKDEHKTDHIVSANHARIKVTKANQDIDFLSLLSVGNDSEARPSTTLPRYNVTENHTNYYQRYAMVLFDDGTGSGANGRYYVAYFTLDSNGNMDTYDESYMVRFTRNINFKGVNGGSVNITGMPANIITTPVTGTTTVPGAAPTTGDGSFEFLGWHTSANVFTPNGDGVVEPNAAAIEVLGENAIDFKATGVDQTYDPDPDPEVNTILDLHAVWRPVKVTATKPGVPQEVYANELLSILSDIGGASRTQKKVSFPVQGDEAKLSDVGLVAGNLGTGGPGKALIQGTPNAETDAPINITVRVTDDVNKTYVDYPVTIPAIKAARQTAPLKDWNTGLAVKGVSAAGVADGEVYGLYSKTPGSNDELVKPENDARIYEYRKWIGTDPYPTDTASEAYKNGDNWSVGTIGMVDGVAQKLTGADDFGKVELRQKPFEESQLAGKANAIDSYAVTGLGEGTYEFKYAEQAGDVGVMPFAASAPTVITIGVGDGESGVKGAHVAFALGNSAIVDDPDTAEDEVADFATYLTSIADKKNGDKLTMPKQIPTREGYAFLGWTSGATTEGDNPSYIYYNYKEGENGKPDAASTITLGDTPIVLVPGWGAKGELYVNLNYYDWDGTRLGNSIIAKDATAEIVTDAMAEFATTFSAETKDTYGYADDATKPLTYKAGYEFENNWLWNDSDAFECYLGEGITYTNGVPLKHELFSAFDAADKATATNIVGKIAAGESVIEVKAAYKARENLNKGGSNKSYYTISPIKYSQLGTAAAATGTYSFTFDVKRVNKDGNPVARLKAPKLKVRTTPAGAKFATFSQVEFDNVDVAKVEILAEKQVKTVEMNVFESFGVKNWTAGTNLSTSVKLYNAEGSGATFADNRGNEGFVRSAARMRIAEAGYNAAKNIDTADWTSATIVAADTFLDAKYPNHNGSMDVIRNDVASMKTNIISAYEAFFDANGTGFLSDEQMLKAITTGNYK